MDDFGDMRRVDRSDTYDASLPRDYLGYDLIQDNLCGPIDKNSAYLPCFIHECKTSALNIGPIKCLLDQITPWRVDPKKQEENMFEY